MKNLCHEQKREEVYTTLMLINDLKRELQKLTGHKISNEKLSIFLGQSKTHITRKIQQIKDKHNYLFSEDVLSIYIQNLESTYGASCVKFIKKYILINSIPKVHKGILKYHPLLKIDYFKEIDSKEKAYWLGFIFADGSICSGKILQFQVELNRKDEILLDRLADAIGFNLGFKKIIKRDDTVRMRFKNNKFAMYLLDHGMIVGKEKSKKIKLPKLDGNNLYLAFLLGCFDGDGKEGTTSIRCGSRKFLEQIKLTFNLENKISSIKYKLKNGEIGEALDFWLGSELFNKMVDNYEKSLPRKRKKLEVYEDEKQRLLIMSFKASMNRMIQKDGYLLNERKKRYSDFAWKYGRKHNFSYSLIKKLCKDYNIESPSKQNWL